MHYDPVATYTPVAEDCFLVMIFSLSMKHDRHLKQLDVNMAFLKSPLLHELWVRFAAGHRHPFGHVIPRLDHFLFALYQPVTHGYTLQHT